MILCIAVACRTAPSWVQPVSHKPLTHRVTRHFLSNSSVVQLVKGLLCFDWSTEHLMTLSNYVEQREGYDVVII